MVALFFFQFQGISENSPKELSKVIRYICYMARYQLNQKKFFNSTEAGMLEAALKRYLYSSEQRDALLILFALRTGARAQELLNIECNDFDFDSCTVLIRGIKRSNDREIPLPDWLMKAMQSHLKRVEGKPFDISYQRLNQIWLYWRPFPKNFHALRHTFAMELYLRTRDIKLVQIALGHRNIQNTMIYLDYVYSRNELRRILF